MESNTQFDDEFLDGIKKAADALHNKIADLQAKCDRYEAALKKIQEICEHDDYGEKSNNCPLCIANEALSGEGEKEEQCTCNAHHIAAHGKCYRCPENQKEDRQ